MSYEGNDIVIGSVYNAARHQRTSVILCAMLRDIALRNGMLDDLFIGEGAHVLC